MLVLQAYHLLAVHQRASKDPLLLGIMQLQTLVALSEIKDVQSDEVALLYFNETVTLKESNGFLMRTPGTVIYLHPVHEVQFLLEEELLSVSFVWEGIDCHYVLGKKEWWRD